MAEGGHVELTEQGKEDETMANENKVETVQQMREDIMALVDKLPEDAVEAVAIYATAQLNAYTLFKMHEGQSA